MYNYIICFPLKLMISFWRTAMSWLHNHAPISCNITPPPLGEGREGGDDRKQAVYMTTLPPETLTQVPTFNKARSNWLGEGAQDEGALMWGGGGNIQYRGIKNIACRIDQGHWMVFCANGSPNGLAIMCIIWTALHALSSAAMKGWTCTARRHSTSRTPWPGRWQNPATAATQLLGEAIQIADGGKLPRV